MDYQALADLLFPDVTATPEELEARFPQRNLPEGAVVTRMAPSPTGFVHLGNLVQGMISERMAHRSNGVLFLRVEDTDAKREVPGAVEVLAATAPTGSASGRIFTMCMPRSWSPRARPTPASARKRS